MTVDHNVRKTIAAIRLYHQMLTCVVSESAICIVSVFFFFSSRRRHTRLQGDWSSDVCSSDLYPHAGIRSIDASAARALPGVSAVLLGDEVARRTEPISVLRPLPGLLRNRYYAMAQETARFEGEPVVAVAAKDRYVAEDALDHIVIDYEPLPHVVEAERAASPDAPILHAE